MKTIHITDATYCAIATAATSPFHFHSTGERQADGTWLVPVSDKTYLRLQSHRLPGETLDDTVLRALRTYLGQKDN